MNEQLELIREQQKQTWNKFAPGWRKWDAFAMNFLKPMGDEIISALELSNSDTVLDVAAGTGEPGLTIAGIVQEGKVVITDLAENMLQVASENVKRRNLSNVDLVACDVSELPFENQSFDAVSCRFGFMFFPDMSLAAKEMARVLRPGGRMATTVWANPQLNSWITTTMSIVNKTMEIEAPPADAPGMFRCARPGFLGELMKTAGFHTIEEKEIRGTVVFENKEQYWQLMNDVAAPVVAALSNATPKQVQSVREQVFAEIGQYSGEQGIALSYGALLIFGEI